MAKKTWAITWRFLAIFLVPAVIVVGILKHYQEPRPVQIGQDAPVFSLPTISGKLFTLASHPKKYVLINFFTTWCPPCQEEAPDFARFINAYGKQVQIIMIDRGEGQGIVSSFVQHYKLQRVIVVLDANDTMAAPYGITGQPETFGISKNGIVEFHIVGPMNYVQLVQGLAYLKQH